MGDIKPFTFPKQRKVTRINQGNLAPNLLGFRSFLVILSSFLLCWRLHSYQNMKVAGASLSLSPFYGHFTPFFPLSSSIFLPKKFEKEAIDQGEGAVSIFVPGTFLFVLLSYYLFVSFLPPKTGIAAGLSLLIFLLYSYGNDKEEEMRKNHELFFSYLFSIFSMEGGPEARECKGKRRERSMGTSEGTCGERRDSPVETSSREPACRQVIFLHLSSSLSHFLSGNVECKQDKRKSREEREGFLFVVRR